MEKKDLRQVLAHVRAWKRVKKAVPFISGEPVAQRIERWQKITAPEISLTQTPYNPEWPKWFKSERERLALNLDKSYINAHHIGSSAVPGLSGKNIIDMAVLVTRSPDEARYREQMAAIGYEDYGNSPCSAEARWFYKVEEDRVFIAHLTHVNDTWYTSAINYRDYLSEFEEQRARYMSLKAELAAHKTDDLLLYSIEKLMLIQPLHEEADAWKASKRSAIPQLEPQLQFAMV